VCALSNLVIAIDGPAGAGKTTIARRVATDLGLQFLDTGAMYRCVALLATRRGFTPENAEGAAHLAATAEISFQPGDPQKVILNGEDVTQAIRDPNIGDFASAVSVHSAVRRHLVAQQQRIVQQGGVILEGRDTTTVVAPKAPVKVFLTAGIDVRAARRHRELIGKQIDADLESLKSMIGERDHRDSTRQDSPLRVADDAHVIDSDGMSIEQVVDAVERLAREYEASASVQS
jgi:cytidylate kinase